MKTFWFIAFVQALLLSNVHCQLNTLALSRMFTNAHQERLQSLASGLAPAAHNHEIGVFAERMAAPPRPQPQIPLASPQGGQFQQPQGQLPPQSARFNQPQQPQQFQQQQHQANQFHAPQANFNRPALASPPPQSPMMQQPARFSPTANVISNTAETGISVSNKILRENIQTSDPRANPLQQLAQFKAPAKFCPFAKNLTCDEEFPYRSFSGACNNLRHQWWGRVDTPYKRWMAPDYSDAFKLSEPRKSIDGSDLPNERDIACSINSDLYEIEETVAHMFMQWGQFMNHDMTSLSIRRDDDADKTICNQCITSDKCRPIMIKSNFTCNCHTSMKHNCIEFTRSSASFPDTECTLGQREQINLQTAFLDGSHIYGVSTADNEKIRNRALGKGMMDLQGGLLPTDKTERPSDCLGFTEKTRCFRAGDDRVNQTPILMSMHTIFIREHNRIARILSSMNPNWEDETVFQEARRIVIALIQHISYNEYLPVLLTPQTRLAFQLTPGIDGSSNYRYNENVDPRIVNEWATAAGRYGHSMVRTEYSRLDKNYKSDGHLPLSLKNVYFRAQPVYDQCQGGLESIMRGLLKDPLMKIDRWFSSGLSQHLFETHDSLGNPFHFDLISINIARGRDHGIPGYLKFRQFCGLPSVTTWTEMKSVIHADVVDKFKELYRWVDDVDLFTASVAEIKEEGALIGPTLNCLLASQFRDTKFGDRFWYETEAFPASFTPEQLREIRKGSLAKVLCRNMVDTPKIQPRALLAHTVEGNEFADCNSMPDIDWTFWQV